MLVQAPSLQGTNCGGGFAGGGERKIVTMFLTIKSIWLFPEDVLEYIGLKGSLRRRASTDGIGIV
jgi:hypothetical protein